MSELPRLKWRKSGRGFIAHPAGSHLAGRCAEVYLQMRGWNTDQTPHRAYESWCWTVRWEGWFATHGYEPSKQAAADKATDEWWAAMQTEPPRDVDLEAAMIAARVMVRPPPNSLLAEDAEFLKKVLWHLKNVYGDEMKRDAEPEPVKLLTGRLSEELHQRRLSGEVAEPKERPPAPPRRMRR